MLNLLVLLICLAALACLALCAAVVLTSDRRHRALIDLAATYATSLEKLASRPSDDVRILIDALLDGRRQMVNALVATNIDPRAAQRLAIVERDAELAEQGPSREQLMSQLRERMVQGLPDDYPADENGSPVVLVGAG